MQPLTGFNLLESVEQRLLPLLAEQLGGGGQSDSTQGNKSAFQINTEAEEEQIKKPMSKSNCIRERKLTSGAGDEMDENLAREGTDEGMEATANLAEVVEEALEQDRSGDDDGADGGHGPRRRLVQRPRAGGGGCSAGAAHLL
jgi:hypothetical protein